MNYPVFFSQKHVLYLQVCFFKEKSVILLNFIKKDLATLGTVHAQNSCTTSASTRQSWVAATLNTCYSFESKALMLTCILHASVEHQYRRVACCKLHLPIT